MERSDDFSEELLAVVAFIASFGFATQALGDEIIDLVRQLTLRSIAWLW